MSDVTDLRSTIVPRSDQRNSEDLIDRPMVIVVTSVEVFDRPEQPVSIHYEGEDGRPYKPSKTMRKILVNLWGYDATLWTGRAMRIICDPEIKFGGEKVGGIVITHMSHLSGAKELSLLMTKGKKRTHIVHPLIIPPLDEVLKAIEHATNKAGMEKAKALAEQLVAQADIEKARTAYGARIKALKGTKPAAETEAKKERDYFADQMEKMEQAADKDAAWTIVEASRDGLSNDEITQLETAFTRAWEE
jgi:hypothetical protein